MTGTTTVDTTGGAITVTGVNFGTQSEEITYTIQSTPYTATIIIPQTVSVYFFYAAPLL